MDSTLMPLYFIFSSRNFSTNISTTLMYDLSFLESFVHFSYSSLKKFTLFFTPHFLNYLMHNGFT